MLQAHSTGCMGVTHVMWPPPPAAGPSRGVASAGAGRAAAQGAAGALRALHCRGRGLPRAVQWVARHDRSAAGHSAPAAFKLGVVVDRQTDDANGRRASVLGRPRGAVLGGAGRGRPYELFLHRPAGSEVGDSEIGRLGSESQSGVESRI